MSNTFVSAARLDFRAGRIVGGGDSYSSSSCLPLRKGVEFFAGDDVK